jgi:hypothetical protein
MSAKSAYQSESNRASLPIFGYTKRESRIYFHHQVPVMPESREFQASAFLFTACPGSEAIRDPEGGAENISVKKIFSKSLIMCVYRIKKTLEQ